TPCPIPESHSEIEPRRTLRQRIALIIGETSTLVQHQSVILNDAQRHRRVESVTEAVAEGEERIDVAARWLELESVAVAMKVAIQRRAGRHFEHLMKPLSAACMKRCADRCQIEMRITPGVAVWPPVNEGNVHVGKHSSQSELVLQHLLDGNPVLPIGSFAKIPGAVRCAVTELVCTVYAGAHRYPVRRVG